MLGHNPLGVAPLSALDGDPQSTAVGTAAGTATASAVGSSEARTAGTVAGSATASASGSSEARSVGTVAGTATAAAVGSSEARAVGTVAGTATAAAVGSSEARAVGTAAGTSTVAAVGVTSRQGAGTSAGTASVAGVARADTRAAGTVAGTASVAGVARADTRSAGTAAGTSTVAGVTTYLADTVSWSDVRDPTISQRGRRGAWAETQRAAVSVTPGRATRFELHTEGSLSLTGRSVELKIGIPVPVGSDDEPTIPIDVALDIDSASQASVLVGAALTAQIGAGYKYAVVLADAGDLPCVHGRVAI